jgi:hypothetical protein
MKHENNLDADEVLTYLVCDVVAGIVHAGADLGFTIPEIEAFIAKGIEHAKFERKLIADGVCSHCQKRIL